MRKFWICLHLHIRPREFIATFLFSFCCGFFFFFFLFRKCTWNMLRPSNDNHQLPVSQVTQCSEGLDVTVGDSRVRHGIDLLRLGHQQMWNNLVICRIRPEHYEITSGIALLLQTLKYAVFWEIILIAYNKPDLFYLWFNMCVVNSVQESIIECIPFFFPRPASAGMKILP